MRFRFCGDLDAPDWLLAEISTLSKVTAVRMKLLLKQVIQYVLTGEINYQKISKLTQESLSGGYSDTKGAVSALHFVLSNSAKYDVDDTTLQLEIQQLGLPKDNADALVRAFRESKEVLRNRFAEQTFRVNALKSVDWRVDQVIASSGGSGGGQVHLKLTVDPSPHVTDSGKESGADAAQSKADEIAFTMPMDKFHIFHHELRQARAQMAKLE